MRRQKFYRSRIFSWCLFFGLLLFAGVLIAPYPSFPEDYSTVVLSAEGQVLNATVSEDEQWRFEPIETVPDKFKESLLLFEDQYFYWHPGFNPVSIFRAFKQNIISGRIISGGSTISMQVARMSRPGKPRNAWQKIIEIFMALKLELLKSKDKILQIYASNAPFGGNVIGLEAASQRYFNRPPNELSWAEAASLAVLPNSPALIYPGKNSTQLKEKRDKLLRKLNREARIDAVTLDLAMMEALPEKPDHLSNYAPHLMTRLMKSEGRKTYHTTLNTELQITVDELVSQFSSLYKEQGINNCSALVLDLKDFSVEAYVGNSNDPSNKHGGDVDIVTAPRSSGSVLKPFLYAASITDGTILPNSLLADIPSFMGGFSPENFSKTYDGLVPASEALVRSLNIPFVFLLNEYGLPAFYEILNNLGFNSFNKPPEYYGLSLILGGGEVSMWELASAYGSMGKMLNDRREQLEIFEPSLTFEETEKNSSNKLVKEISSGAAWLTLKNLTNLTRPDEEIGWHYFTSKQPVAWKTGTSFGFRDAWACGLTPEHLVVVWVGNADGQGIPGLTGTSKAAPLMFRIFEKLRSQSSQFFNEPYDDLKLTTVCKISGSLCSPNCEEKDTILIPYPANPDRLCEYHQLVHLSKDGQFRVNSSCYNSWEMEHKIFFVLPPKYANFYKKKHSDYVDLPEVMHGCSEKEALSFIYPDNGIKIYLPKDFDGISNPVVFEAAHENEQEPIRWFLNDQFLGETQYLHQMAIAPEKGKHTVTITDVQGNEASIDIEILSSLN